MKTLLLLYFLLSIETQKQSSLQQLSELNPPVADYTEVAIGNQIWMAKNLDVSAFRNGDAIPEAKTNEEWLNAIANKTPAWCYYENNSTNAATCGKLYNWYAVNDARGLAPKGWHIPTDAEWVVLSDFLGGNDQVSIKMKAKTGWTDNGNGTNESGFDANPAGFRDDYKAEFYGLGNTAFWWSSTLENTDKAWTRSLGWYTAPLRKSSYKIGGGMSVRCVKD